MTRRLWLLALFLLSLVPAYAAPEPPKILAPEGILVDARTGTVLWSRNPDGPRPMASTTKIMTALLVLESNRLAETVEVSPDAAKIKESSLNLKPGEHMTLSDLLRGIIMRSANDACVVAAEHLDGSVPAFVARMNARAVQLGCTHTHFANPNGLHNQFHYSSARDLAIITRAAMMYPAFRQIVSTPDYTIERDMNRYDRHLKARDHWFLIHYPGANGVKTGYTRQAGHCFVGSATRKGFQLISVLMHSSNVRKETCALMDWGYRNYRGEYVGRAGRAVGLATVRGGAQKSVRVSLAGPVYTVVPVVSGPVTVRVDRTWVKAPVPAGQVVGHATLISEGRIVGGSDVIAMNAVDRSLLRKAGYAVLALLGIGGVVLGATAKAARRRRRRITTRRRRDDTSRASERQRAGSRYR